MISFNQKNALLIGGGILTFAAGGGLGFFIAKKKLETKYDELADAEIAKAKRFYAQLNKTDEYSTPESVVDDLGLNQAAEALLEYQGEDPPSLTVEIPAEKVEIVTEVQNVFTTDSKTPEFDFAIELPLRTHERPYILSEEEYFENEIERKQVALMYYAGDNVLVDERERQIPDVDTLVGEENLKRFGHGARDSRMLYIRNEVKDVEFEIEMSPGKYSREVLGVLEHSDRRDNRQHRKTPKFKPEE